jgi:hypothetical protein
MSGVHLVGSVPLETAEAVFRAVSAGLGAHLASIPDGETGVRKDWIAWQHAVLAATPGLEPMPAGDRGYLRRQLVHRAPGAGPLRFGPLGYAEAALASYAVFERLQREGVVPGDVRFQVSLPTPLAPMTVFVDLADRAAVEPAYEARLLEELRLVTSTVPHQHLAIQWDVAVEIALLHGAFPAHFDDVDSNVVARLARLARAVPTGVPVGFHLCYGDFGHRHFLTPEDASTLVRVANAVGRLDRPISWIHMPVPVEWTSPAPFAPLAQLALQEATRLYLGVIHMRDGVAGARRRIALARGVVPGFGVATECGWGRRPAGTIPALIGLHAEVASALP